MLGSLIGAALGFIGGERTNSANAAMARDQMDFQERMANTSYQRAVSDMQQAGLNPMLAYSQGGAASPAGATAVMGDSVSSAVSGFQKSLERDVIEQQLENLKIEGAGKVAQNEKTQEETRLLAQQRRFGDLFGEDKARGELYNILGVGDVQSADVKLKNQQTNKVIAEIQQVIQSVRTGHATEDQLRALTKNLNLDSAEKEAFAKLWRDIGESGAAGKAILPFLQLIMKGLK